MSDVLTFFSKACWPLVSLLMNVYLDDSDVFSLVLHMAICLVFAIEIREFIINVGYKMYQFEVHRYFLPYFMLSLFYFLCWAKTFKVFIWRENMEKRRNRDLPLASSLSSAGLSCSWTDLKAGTRNFFPVPHVSAGAQVLGPSSATFSITITELDWKGSKWDTNQCTNGMVVLQIEDIGFLCCCASPVQKAFLLS